MRNALIALVLVLLAGTGIGWLVWHERSAVAHAAELQTQLDTATTANQGLAKSLAQVRVDQAKDRAQVLELSAQLEQIRTTQQATKSNVAKVVEHATPPDQDLLGRKLPAAVLGLLPTGPRAADHGAGTAAAAEPAG
ncbi:hypothetical protein ACNE9Y_24755 [Pseudomonas sp. NY11226]|uniref:hypothetical protein n=1 Tax=Pseudomonas sp. NY11226 TaxID=3400362 RepID=UPI003A84EF3F